MVRFDTGNRGDPVRRAPRNYLARREQYRLLVLVFALMLVFLLMGQAAKPKNWQWLWQLSTGAQVIDSQAERAESINTRLSDPGAIKTAPVGVFISAADDARVDTNRIGDDLFPGVTRESLSAIRDDTVFRSAEADTWFDWLALLREARSDDLAGISDVGFVQLFRQSDEYRGRLVRVQGIVRRAHIVSARKNDQGINHYWQCWLFAGDSGANPIVVYALGMPDGFPTGLSINEQVTFTALFFKRWAYQAASGTLSAPLVLARGGQWAPAPQPQSTKLPGAKAIAAALLATASLGILIALVVYHHNKRATTALTRLRKSGVTMPPIPETLDDGKS